MANFSQEKQSLQGLVAASRSDLDVLSAIDAGWLQATGKEAGFYGFDPSDVHELHIRDQQPATPVYLQGTRRIGSFSVAVFKPEDRTKPLPFRRGKVNDDAYNDLCAAAALYRDPTEREAEQAHDIYARRGFKPVHLKVFEMFVPSPIFRGTLTSTGNIDFVPARLKPQDVERRPKLRALSI